MSQYPPDPNQDPYSGAAPYSPPPPNVGGKVKPPAICLIVVGSISVLYFLFTILAGVIRLAGGQTTGVNQFTGQPYNTDSLIRALVTSGCMLVASVVVLCAAVSMLRRGSWGFAMIGAVIATIPCLSPCCALGIPFGIWATVILCNADVKAAFK